jgi:anti-anti-sigma factor
MIIDERIDNDLVSVALAGRLDSMTAPEVEQRLLARATAASVNLVLDLSGLDYISSAGLRVILMVAKRTKAAQGQFVLCGMKEQIRTIFEVSGFLTILRVVERCEDAPPVAGSA